MTNIIDYILRYSGKEKQRGKLYIWIIKCLLKLPIAAGEASYSYTDVMDDDKIGVNSEVEQYKIEKEEAFIELLKGYKDANKSKAETIEIFQQQLAQYKLNFPQIIRLVYDLWDEV